MNLFQRKDFISHSGIPMHWKIECDALCQADWEALALMASEILPPFGYVDGIPRGGIPLAKALTKYATEGPLLIADDVTSTGKSFEDFRDGRPNTLGVVVFARGKCPDWVTAIFRMSTG